ncbi:MAG: aldehyde dehydrogenase PuuC [Alphaproteobacteria bacterium]|nr:MAG: aldehyde dehydrogenase PuuC [Alphaproteobacteria bacterium]
MNTIDWVKRAAGCRHEIKDFIAGKYVSCNQTNHLVSKYSPRDGGLLYQFTSGNDTTLDAAIESAKRAFNEGCWRDMAVQNRASVLNRLADLVEIHKEEFALNEALDVGKPIAKALSEDIGHTIYCLRNNAEMAVGLVAPSATIAGCHSYQLRKPIGVVGAIVGWNYPLALAASKVGPALAMGNSIVLKPSEFTSLSAARLAELAVEAGVPSGVFNVVHGTGTELGSAMAHSPDIDLVSFTGSSATGKQIMAASAKSNMKRLLLECGGKSPFIVFNDCPADLQAVAANVVGTAFANQGALCVSGTRLLVQKSIKEKFLDYIKEHVALIKPQDPLKFGTQMGAILNEAHMEKVLTYIRSGIEEGADLLCGGARLRLPTDSPCKNGFYLEPTVFDNVAENQLIAKEEIFGPVLSVFSFDTEEEAIALANNTPYGLAAYVATTDLGRSQRLAQALHAGSIKIFGTSSPGPKAADLGLDPHKQSGFGWEGGVGGLLSYTANSMIHQFS